MIVELSKKLDMKSRDFVFCVMLRGMITSLGSIVHFTLFLSFKKIRLLKDYYYLALKVFLEAN